LSHWSAYLSGVGSIRPDSTTVASISEPSGNLGSFHDSSPGALGS
jgi:hypothetical protein